MGLTPSITCLGGAVLWGCSVAAENPSAVVAATGAIQRGATPRHMSVRADGRCWAGSPAPSPYLALLCKPFSTPSRPRTGRLRRNVCSKAVGACTRAVRPGRWTQLRRFLFTSFRPVTDDELAARWADIAPGEPLC